MKSLEMVNDYLELIDVQKKRMNKEELLMNVDGEIVKESELQQIKQDLEVLEILKKYLYIVENQIPRTDDYFEILESDLDEMQDDENCDDFHKVKQWLEENEE